jgi:hypothetical protein
MGNCFCFRSAEEAEPKLLELQPSFPNPYHPEPYQPNYQPNHLFFYHDSEEEDEGITEDDMKTGLDLPEYGHLDHNPADNAADFMAAMEENAAAHDEMMLNGLGLWDVIGAVLAAAQPAAGADEGFEDFDPPNPFDIMFPLDIMDQLNPL